jgi:hypothetical protein
MNAKSQSSKFEIPVKAEKRALSANQRFFRQVLRRKERLRRFLQGNGRWNGRKKISERRRASFFETSRERLEAREILNVKVQNPNAKKSNNEK